MQIDMPRMQKIHLRIQQQGSRYITIIQDLDEDLDFKRICKDMRKKFSCNGNVVNDEKIGEIIAGLVEDGATLQLGIGGIPDAVLRKLSNHKNLGIHTEMFSDGVIDLILKDVINGNFKAINPGRALATFLMGSKRLYDYVDDNPFIELRASDYVNDVSIIKQNPKMVAINSAIEVDVTGQVCADSIGSKIYSGVGGQMDYIRGASLSEGGKAIIALPSITKNGDSRIVPFSKQGAGVVTTRSHIQYIITENGIADLYGKTLRQRVAELVKIAHPNHQEWIDKEYYVTASKSEITLWRIKDENPISLLDTGRSEPIIILASKVSSKGRFSIAAASK